MAPPEPRPLYNQPGIASAEQVILVEGEKCAQALIDAGFIATGPRMSVQPVGREPDPSDDAPSEPDDQPHGDATVWGSEDALAVSFTRRYQRDWRYIALWGKWLMWDGNGSPAGSALWFVAGMQLSIRDWALREGWNDKCIEKNEAKGILVAGLAMLARYHGYERSGPRSVLTARASP